MNTVIERATALGSVLRAGGQPGATVAIGEAVVRCSHDLLDGGEAVRAIQLIDVAEAAAIESGRPTQLRLLIAKVRALQQKARHEESLALAASIRLEFAEELRTLHSERAYLTIFETGNLWVLSRADEACETLTALRSELLTSPDTDASAMCALQLSNSEFIRGNYAASREHTLEALVSARRCGSTRVEAFSQNNLDRLERALCRWAAAEEAATESLRIFESQGWTVFANVARRGLALSVWKRGRLQRALDLVDECIAQSRDMGERVQLWYLGLFRGCILLHEGDHRAAEQHFGSYANWIPETNESRPSLLTTEFLGDVHLEQGNADEAMRYYDEVWPKALALVPKGDIAAELRRRRAEVFYLQGNFERAYEEALGGLEHCRELGDRYEEAATYRVLALSAAAREQHDEARRWFDQGFAYFDDIETPYEWGKLWLAYGDWLSGPHAGSHADMKGALEAYHAARDHFERMGARARLAEANQRIAGMMAAQTETDAAARNVRAGHPRHARRRPPGSAELDRRSDWARETYGMITRNKTTLQILEDVAKLAASTTPILVLGESGTGKELVAGGVHRLSGRKGTFVPVNCGALPRDIIESELFGHTAGSFTGASRDKAGLVEVCDNGTIFLDEVAEMTLESQSRLLRFLETGETRRVGSTRHVKVDTRIVAATNRERHALENGDGFRPDLYYRLAHAVVTLPPLRRRGEDVDLLIEYFLDAICAEENREVHLSPGAWKRLRTHPWPGNIRQLRSAIKRVVLLAAPGSEVDESLLHLDDTSHAPANLLEEMEFAERQRIREALVQARGSRTEAARSLGIPRTTFINKLRRFGLS